MKCILFTELLSYETKHYQRENFFRKVENHIGEGSNGDGHGKKFRVSPLTGWALKRPVGCMTKIVR
jgi:hypothetical protein